MGGMGGRDGLMEQTRQEAAWIEIHALSLEPDFVIGEPFQHAHHR